LKKLLNGEVNQHPLYNGTLHLLQISGPYVSYSHLLSFPLARLLPFSNEFNLCRRVLLHAHAPLQLAPTRSQAFTARGGAVHGQATPRGREQSYLASPGAALSHGWVSMANFD
jgi:hypothetical protein